MRLVAFIFSALVCFSQAVLAESPLPEARSEVVQNVDFYGSDLQPFFETTQEACQRICVADARCVAYTFNARSNACFPKSAIRERAPYDGAVSVVLARYGADEVARAVTRRAELVALPDADIARARAQAAELGLRFPAGAWTAEDLAAAVRTQRAAGNLRAALRWQATLTALTDAPEDWLEFARLSGLVPAETGRERRSYEAQARSAALNGYLRAEAPPLRASLLIALSDQLERDGRGRLAVRALRLAERTQARPDVVQALDAMIAKHGFRVLRHDVESDLAAPRLCAVFSEDLHSAGVDYAPYVQLPDPRLAVSAEKRRLCVAGVEHGARYEITLRRGLPSAEGEVLRKDVRLRLYVRDRAPVARFTGRAYVLPKAPDAGVPIETVNLTSVDLVLRRVSDRNLVRSLQQNAFGRAVSAYAEERLDTLAEVVWSGSAPMEMALNRSVTTRLPMGEAIGDLPPGLYALTARVPGQDPFESDGATQWFVVSDIGLATLGGADGLHVTVRSLATAEALAGTEVALVSRANRVLGEGVADAAGRVQFAPGLMRGTGGAAPALVTAKRGGDDLTFLPLTGPAFDLSDRGVEGNPPAAPIDVFVTTDRGAYRAGAVIHATALVRDDVGAALPDLPLTAVLTRPDGVEYTRKLADASAAGGHVFAFATGASVPRGTWGLAMYADTSAAPLARTRVLVEDLVPERIDFDLGLPETPLAARRPVEVRVTARYLFGAPGADLPLEARVRVAPVRRLEAFPGVVFGRHDAERRSVTRYQTPVRTDAEGDALLSLALPERLRHALPLELTVIGEMAEGSGRPVERSAAQIMLPDAPLLGLKPAAEGPVPEGSTAVFDVMALAPDLTPAAAPVVWHVNRVETEYQWYAQNGRWRWEPITSRTRVAEGRLDVGAETPGRLEVAVDWGRYELVAVHEEMPAVAASLMFEAGWGAAPTTDAAPDRLEVTLDKARYAPGETAVLTLEARAAGRAVVSVLSHKVIDTIEAEVSAGTNRLSVPVTEAWGSGVYVTAQVIRPLEEATGRVPVRALGLVHAAVDPGPRALDVTLEAPVEVRPNTRMTARVKVGGLTGVGEAHLTLATVDVGVLNLTGFEPPDPQDHYFGQRRLGVALRDLYGRLLDGQSGVLGALRSGGDGSAEARLQAPPPTEEVVALFSGLVTVDASGVAEVPLDLPAFNGTLKLMAVAWTETAVGQASADVLVRDPVVITAAMPRFLAPGDTSRLALTFAHTGGAAGEMALAVDAGGVTLTDAPETVTLPEGGRSTVSLSLTADTPGDHEIEVALTLPGGEVLRKPLVLGVRDTNPEVSDTRRLSLAPGETLTLGPDLFAGLSAGRATLAAGPLARFDAPGLLMSLDRYPYGCTEQVTSRALPLLALPSVATAVGLGTQAEIDAKLAQAIGQVLARQDSNGAFGLWRTGGGDLWLDAYVTDFLSRARSQGHTVPEHAFETALDNLQNRVNYAPDFDRGGEGLAYALYVLAREGQAAMGTLRYYADEKARAFATPLAAAQMGAALALYGDQRRADALFSVAASAGSDDAAGGYRADYGTAQRDLAGLLTLAVTHGAAGVDTQALSRRITALGRPRSTQEQAWTLLAAAARGFDARGTGLTLDGKALTGPQVEVLGSDTLTAPRAVTNAGARPVDITLTTFGVPQGDVAASSFGYVLTRRYYTMEGAPMPDTVEVGDRFVTVLTLTPAEDGRARIMVDDALPAGFEIDNSNLLRAGDVRALDWLKPAEAVFTEARTDRFLAAIDKRGTAPVQLAYIVRAVSPGSFHHPPAVAEDMYQPAFGARTASGRIEIR
ncbi:alpha-2-macroglobulin family protein [Pseudaestuariivita sp.]|uniref:alpha-2-macroglobulin family protein n=1 Tax=Pseudaestuariivita sp. TaxID=2211669 RepID=UPI00405A4924